MRIIKLVFLFMFFSFVFIVPEIFNQTKNISEGDGTDWLRFSESYKFGFVAGLMAGSLAAKMEFRPWIDILIDIFEKEEIEKEEIKNKSKEKWNAITFFGFTVNQIKDGVEFFYKDFSNRRIKVIDAIYIVKMQTEGKDSELINAQIRYLKMQPINEETLKKSFEKWLLFWKEWKRYPTYKEIKNGDFNNEDMLRSGYYVDVNNKAHDLFRYGNYK